MPIGLPNKCPTCTMEKCPDCTAADYAQEATMAVGKKGVRELMLISTMPVPPDWERINLRIVVCGCCGCIFAKETPESVIPAPLPVAEAPPAIAEAPPPEASAGRSTRRKGR